MKIIKRIIYFIAVLVVIFIGILWWFGPGTGKAVTKEYTQCVANLSKRMSQTPTAEPLRKLGEISGDQQIVKPVFDSLAMKECDKQFMKACSSFSREAACAKNLKEIKASNK